VAELIISAGKSVAGTLALNEIKIAHNAFLSLPSSSPFSPVKWMSTSV